MGTERVLRLLKSRVGNAYIEYFIVAGAMAAGAVALYGVADFGGGSDAVMQEFRSQMDQIAGPVSP